MSNFVNNVFKNLTSAVLNVIIIALSVMSILGLTLLPTLKIKAEVTFTEDVAEVLLPKNQSESEEEQIVQSVVKELVKANTSIRFEIKLTTADLFSCALDSSNLKTQDVLYSYTDTVADSVDENLVAKVELAIAKVGVETVIKKQIDVLSETLGSEGEEVLQNIGVTDEYLSQQTQAVLDSIKADDATVDTITDTIMDIVEDVDGKLQNSDYKDQVDQLTDESKEEIRQTIEDLVNSLADENGNVDGDSLISSLLTGLMSGEGSQSFAMPNGATASPLKDGAFEQENPEQNISVSQLLKDKLRSIVTLELAKIVRLVFLGILIAIGLTALSWAYLILKIVAKTNSKNPLVKLKAPISVSWLPFVILFALPNALFMLLANPPQILSSALSQEGLSLLSAVGSAIKINVFSSTLIPFVLSVVLLVFGVFYSARRKQIDKDLKTQKTKE